MGGAEQPAHDPTTTDIVAAWEDASGPHGTAHPRSVTRRALVDPWYQSKGPHGLPLQQKRDLLGAVHWVGTLLGQKCLNLLQSFWMRRQRDRGLPGVSAGIAPLIAKQALA